MSLYEKVSELFAFCKDNCETDIIDEFFHAQYTRDKITRWYPDDEDWQAFHKKADDLGIIIESKESKGGEGQGEEYWAVYCFTDACESIYIKFDGYYQSYEGATFEQFYQVIPKQKTITVYEQV